MAEVTIGFRVTAYGLNKPATIIYTNGDQITYTYDGSGNKISETFASGGNSTTTDYVGGMIYKDDNFVMAQNVESRIVQGIYRVSVLEDGKAACRV